MTAQRILDTKGKGAAHIAPDATIADFLNSLKSQNAVSAEAEAMRGYIQDH
jgi:hypothetical protein